MLTSVKRHVSAFVLVSALALPMQTASVQAGDAGAAFVGGLVGGIAAGIISNAGKNPRKKTYRSSSRNSSSRTSASRTENINIQKALNFYGFDVGVADGALGRKSKAGIRQFQSAYGFVPTGQLTAQEKALLLSIPFNVETILYQKGYAVGAVDGKIDQQTAIAISQFQMEAGSPATGQLTPQQAFMLMGQQAPAQAPAMAVQRQQPPLMQQQDVALRPAAVGTMIGASASQWPAINPDEFTKGKPRNNTAVAIIIGNQSYSNQDIPDVEFAKRDAEAMKYTFAKTMGIPEDNIVLIEDATLSEMNDTFGNTSPDGSLLWSLIDPDGASDVYVFYSGHGIPSQNSDAKGEAYLAPTDIVSTSSIQSSYPLKKLYDNLSALPTKSTTVFIDACFSGQAGDGKMIIQSASPVFIRATLPEESKTLNIFAAAKGDEIASWDEEKGHGIFTETLVAGLSGQADLDDDGQVSTGELDHFLAKRVSRSARRTWRREQTPTFNGNAEQVLVTF